MKMFNTVSTQMAWPRRYQSAADISDVWSDFDRVVDTFLWPHQTSANFQPSCDVNEFKDHYLASFDMPGVRPEDLRIEVKNNELVISGERHRTVKNSEGESMVHLEKAYGKFERSFTLPTTVAADKIEAHYENGVLNVALPKAEAAKGRTIQIQTGQGGLLSRLLGSQKEVRPQTKEAQNS